MGPCAWLALNRSTCRSDRGFEPALGAEIWRLRLESTFPMLLFFAICSISNPPQNASTVRP
jgi:predicted phage gp36 major capsid-like protein